MFSDSLQKFLFGRFTLESIPFHEPILQATFAGVRSAASRCSPRSPTSGSGARCGGLAD